MSIESVSTTINSAAGVLGAVAPIADGDGRVDVGDVGSALTQAAAPVAAVNPLAGAIVGLVGAAVAAIGRASG